MYSVVESQLNFESGGKSIRIDSYAPTTNRQLCPAIIGLHGSGGGYPLVMVPGRLLAVQGFAVFVLHYFNRTDTDWVSDRATIIKHGPAWVKTVWDAISFIAQQPKVDSERVGLLGFSLGAYLALATASIDSRVKAVVDFFGGFPREMRLFMRRFCPVLILHGDADDTVPVSEAHYIATLAEKKKVPYEMKIYPGAGHGFSPEVMDDARQRTLDFLRKHLG